VRWLVFAGLACSSPPDPQGPAPRRSPVVAKSSKATPSAAPLGPDTLVVSPYGTQPAACADCDRCEVSSVTASSERPADGGETFGPDHLLDGNPSSAWCDAPREGEPSTVTFTVPAGCRVVGARILSGHAGSRARLEANGRAAEITLTAGRLSGEAEIDDPVGLPLNLKQLVDAPATLRTGWDAYPIDALQITFREVHRGSEHGGVCLSGFSPILAGAPTDP